VGQGTSATSPTAGSSAGKHPRNKAGGATPRGGSSRPAKASEAKGNTEPHGAEAKAKPYGREQVIESIIDATLSLWSAKGPAEVSLRAIAARAGVNYGLVYRHFRTKEAVIRAAMDRVVARSLMYIQDCTDLVDAMDSVLPRSTGAHARLLAWAILQYLVDDILPAEDPFLQRLRELAKADLGGDVADADTAAKVRAGSLLAMLYGWRLFEPYLVRGLQLETVSHDELDALIRERMLKALSD
jgi:TetR/AcrR family transcriptional regulator, repressor for neighboring sulfatase